MIAGHSQAGGGEIASLANAPERGMLCHAHLRGRTLQQVTRWRQPELPADPWALCRQEIDAPDQLAELHRAYFDAVNHDLTLFDVVGDAYSWQMPMLPAVHRARPIARLLVVVRNGILWVEAVRRARAGSPDDHYVFNGYLADCCRLMGLPPPPPHGRFATICAEWTLAVQLPNFMLTRGFDLGAVDPAGLVQLRHPHVRLLRCEDLAGSEGAGVLAETCHWLAARPLGGAERDPAAWVRLRSLAAADPAPVWASWTEPERTIFTDVCGKAMGLLGYALPPVGAAA